MNENEIVTTNLTNEKLSRVKEGVRELVNKALQENKGGTLTNRQTLEIKIETFSSIYGNRLRYGTANNGSIYEIPDSRGIFVDDLIVADPLPFGEQSKAVRFTLAEESSVTIYGGLPEELRTSVQKGDRVISVGLAPYIYAPQIGKEYGDGGMFLYCEKIPNQPDKEDPNQT